MELESKSEDEVQDLIGKAAQRAIEEDGAEVICLGCAGMTGLDKQLKMIEGLIVYGAQTSKVGAYARPKEKELIGLNDIFLRGYQ